MTLIVGIKCSNGVVLGAEGHATMGALGRDTIRQSAKKLTILADELVVGVSGPAGTSQLYAGAIADLWSNGVVRKAKPHDAMVLLQEALWPHCERQLRNAKVSRDTLGQVALESCIANTIVAMPLQNEVRLLHLNEQCLPEESTADLPFVSIGEGEPIADPFLAFLRSVFWADRLPSLSQGVFSVYWTLKHAIDVNPGGLSKPIQIVSLTGAKGEFRAHELQETELVEHDDAIRAVYDAMRSFKVELSKPAEASDLPPAP